MSRRWAVVLAVVVVAAAGCDDNDSPATAEIDYSGEVAAYPELPTPSGVTGDAWSCQVISLKVCTETIASAGDDAYCATLFDLGLEAHPKISDQWGMTGDMFVCDGFHNGWWYVVQRDPAGDVGVDAYRYETLAKFLEDIKSHE